MKLKLWLQREKGRTQASLAEELRRRGLRKTHQATIARLLSSGPTGRRASLQMALAIEAVTDSEVRAEDLPLSRATRRALALLREHQASGSSESAA